MLALALNFALGCFAVALLLNIWRIGNAPTLPDRILAVDTMVVNMIALIALYGVRLGSVINFEAELLLAMTGFVSTVAFCKFLLRGSIIE